MNSLVNLLTLESDWSCLHKSIVNLEAELGSSIPPSLEMCGLLIAGEDHRFWTHSGVDFYALCRAFIRTTCCGSRQGGSTIAMQLVRTISGRYEKTLLRKLREMVLAFRLTRHISRERLPVLYLWAAYYGWRMNNFSQACYWLGIDPHSVSSLDAARLVSRLKYPQPRNANTMRFAKIERRAHHLLRLHHRTRTATESQEETLWNRLKLHYRLSV